MSLRRLYEQIRRFCYYGWAMRNAYEFDSYSIIVAEYHSASRLVDYMKSDATHCMWNSSKQTNLMKKLLEYHEVLGRIKDDSYIKHYSKACKEVYGDDYFSSHKFFDRINEELPKADENKIRRALRRDQADEARDWERYHELRKKYLRSWWD